MWSKGMSETYYKIEYRADFGSWQTLLTVDFESYDEASEYANEHYYHYRIFRVVRTCLETNPGYG